MGVPASFLPPPAPRRGGAWGSQPVLAGTAEPRGCVEVVPCPTPCLCAPTLSCIWSLGLRCSLQVTLTSPITPLESGSV